MGLNMCDGDDHGLCCVSCCFPCVVISQLWTRMGNTRGCSIMGLLIFFQASAFFFFFADELMFSEILVIFFMAMNCKDPDFSNIGGIPTGLPWVMTKVTPDPNDAAEVAWANGTLFPCPNSNNRPGQGVTAGINDSVDIALAFTIAFVVSQLMVFILSVSFIVYIRSQLRQKGQVDSSCLCDVLCSLTCPCCFLALTMRESGMAAKTYSITASDGSMSYSSVDKDGPTLSAA